MLRIEHITKWMIPVLREAGHDIKTMDYIPSQNIVWVCCQNRQFRIKVSDDPKEALKDIVLGIMEECKNGYRG